MKKKIAGIIIFCCIAAAGIAGYFMYQKKAEQMAIDEQFNQIYAIGTEFSAAESREEQLNVLKNVLTEREAYIKDKKHSEEVADKYDSVILGMQGVFVKAYDSEIADSTLENLDEEEDASVINDAKDKLDEIASKLKSDKDYIFQDEKEYKNYQNKIDKLKERYADRLNEIEAQKKAREEAQRKAEEEAEAERKKAEEEARKESERVYAETHYENDYFSVDTSSDWIGDWKMTEEDQSTNGILCKKYVFDYHPDKENYGGLAEVYVIDMSDDSIPESVYDKMYPDYASEVGTTSFGAYHIFMLQVGGDFFGESNDHATLTVK